jgi:hypothetical protein
VADNVACPYFPKMERIIIGRLNVACPRPKLAKFGKDLLC